MLGECWFARRLCRQHVQKGKRVWGMLAAIRATMSLADRQPMKRLRVGLAAPDRASERPRAAKTIPNRELPVRGWVGTAVLLKVMEDLQPTPHR